MNLDYGVFEMNQTKETWTTESRSIMCSLLLWANYVPTGFWGNYIKAIINLFLQQIHCIVRATDITFVWHTIFNYSNSRLLQHLWFAIFFLCSSDSAKVLTVSSAGSDVKVMVHKRCCIKSIQNNRTIIPVFPFLFHVSVCLSLSNS